MAAQGSSSVPPVEAPDATMEEAAAAGDMPEPEMSSTASIAPVDMGDGDSEGSEELDDWEFIRQHDVEVTVMPPRDSAQPDEWRARRQALERKIAEWENSPEGIACGQC